MRDVIRLCTMRHVTAKVLVTFFAGRLWEFLLAGHFVHTSRRYISNITPALRDSKCKEHLHDGCFELADIRTKRAEMTGIIHRLAALPSSHSGEHCAGTRVDRVCGLSELQRGALRVVSVACTLFASLS